VSKILCLHCGVRFVSRPRGLCHRCFYAPGVKELYSPVSKYGVRGVGQGCINPVPPAPTESLPGTESKLNEFGRRAAAGLSLFAAGDARRGLS
jgi:hypothetical protein